MPRFRNWHKLESKAALHELKPLSVAFARSYINIILRDKNDKKQNVILDRDEAITLIARLTAGIHKIR